jgi:mono/diheme cytochrome c family protein
MDGTAMRDKLLWLAPVFLVWACATIPSLPDSEIRDAMTRERDAAHGKILYEHECISCHREHGEGGGVAAGVLQRAMPKKDEYLYRSIKTGVGSWMPAFSKMTPQDTVDVIAYIRSLFPGT